MRMNDEKAVEIIKKRRQAIDHLETLSHRNEEFQRWYKETEIDLKHVAPESLEYVQKFQNISFGSSMKTRDERENERRNQEGYQRGLGRAKVLLESFVHEIDNYGRGETASGELPALRLIDDLCNGFHACTRHLIVGKTHGKQAITNLNDIQNEYDVQFLIHAILKLHFDDIIPEEYTPSYAGSNSQIDFILKDEKVAIEVKKTRSGLDDKELGEQLLVDIARYQKHPDCETLVCFVYDPESRIANPRRIEKDLIAQSSESLEVIVYIRPIQ